MKMHGLGNDFVVVDERGITPRVDATIAIAIADRHRGVGFDQLAVLSNTPDADVHLTFWNSDGSLSAACGNATRCIARHLLDTEGKDALTITTDRGALLAKDAGNGLTSVNMGLPQLNWNDVPLAQEMDTLELPIPGAPTATGMGNPHCTFFVDDAEAVDLAKRGAEIEHHPLYPTNECTIRKSSRPQSSANAGLGAWRGDHVGLWLFFMCDCGGGSAPWSNGTRCNHRFGWRHLTDQLA